MKEREDIIIGFGKKDTVEDSEEGQQANTKREKKERRDSARMQEKSDREEGQYITNKINKWWKSYGINEEKMKKMGMREKGGAASTMEREGDKRITLTTVSTLYQT